MQPPNAALPTSSGVHLAPLAAPGGGTLVTYAAVLVRPIRCLAWLKVGVATAIGLIPAMALTYLVIR